MEMRNLYMNTPLMHESEDVRLFLTDRFHFLQKKSEKKIL